MEYTTSDRFSKFKNFFGSLQKGNFTVSLQLDEGYTISEASEGNQTMKDTLVYAVKIVNHPSSSTQILKYYFIPKTPDIYNFTLKMSKDGKVFQVKFEVRVKKYNFRLFKKEHSELYDIDFNLGTGYQQLVLGSISANTDKSDDDGITYSSGDNPYSSGDNPTTFNNYEIMKNNPQPFTIVQTGQTEKKYTFPINSNTNSSFFNTVNMKMKEKIAQVYQEKLLAVLKQLLQQPPQHIAPEVNDNTKLATSNPISTEEEVYNDEQQSLPPPQLIASG